jgi:hypothetical protein
LAGRIMDSIQAAISRLFVLVEKVESDQEDMSVSRYVCRLCGESRTSLCECIDHIVGSHSESVGEVRGVVDLMCKRV